MDKVKVLVLSSSDLDEGYLDDIAAIDPLSRLRIEQCCFWPNSAGRMPEAMGKLL